MKNLFNNPLEQFDIVIINILYHDIALTNIATMTFINLSIVILFFTNFKSNIIFNPLEYIIYASFNLIKTILKENMNVKKYSFIFLFYFLFLFIFISNLIGMTPYSITITSHAIFTLYYSLAFFIGINIIGVLYHQENYFALFLPEGVPLAIIPLIIVIEYVSHFAKIFSLAIRLFANLMSGHILLKILMGFVWSMITSGSLFALISFMPLLLIFCLTGLECAIAFLQAYVFIVLLSVYLDSVINLH